jgi:shikimate kinase
MTEVAESIVVVITGPVGAGKSTTALAVAAALRARGKTAAVIDLDQVYGMVRQREGFGEVAAWKGARRGAAALADSFLASGLDVVVVEGEVFSAAEMQDLQLASKASTRFFTLVVSCEEVFRRVDGDRSRGASRNPRTLQRFHDHFRRARADYLDQASVQVEAERRPLDEVAAGIVETLLTTSPRSSA